MDYQFEKNKLYDILGSYWVSLLKKHKVIIAGGAITSIFTGSKINDIDIYFRNEKNFFNIVKEVWDDRKTSFYGVTDKSIIMRESNPRYVEGNEQFRLDIQFIHFKFFSNPEEIFNTFDFTVCMGAFDFSTESFVLHDNFLLHNSQKILRFNSNTAFPIVSLLRVEKYENKGYKISKSELIRVILKCMTLDITNVEELKAHLSGMYGLAMDKLVEFNQEEEFSLEKVIDSISKLYLHDDYFKMPLNYEISSWEVLLQKIAKNPFDVFEHQGKKYIVQTDGIIAETDKFPKNHNLKTAHEVLEPMKFYKFVNKDKNGRYTSFYDPSFVYKIHEKMTPKQNDYLYFAQKEQIEKMYSYGNTVLEVLIPVQDWILKEDVKIKAKSCIVLREVPSKEWQNFNDPEEDLNFNQLPLPF